MQLAKNILAPVLGFLSRPFLSKGGTILTYHQVVSPGSRELVTSPSEFVSYRLFKKHLKWLQAEYTIIPLSELLRRYRDRQALDDTVAITFDDGWKNTYTEAFSLLKKNQIPGTIFLATNFIGTNAPIWFSSLKRVISECEKKPFIVKRMLESADFTGLPPQIRERVEVGIKNSNLDELTSLFKHVDSKLVSLIVSAWSELCRGANVFFEDMDLWLTWEDLLEMDESGLIEFGPHGDHHYFFNTISENTIYNEIKESWNKISTRLKHSVKCFCYPGGQYFIRHINIIKSMGMEFAVTYSGGKIHYASDPYQLPRNGIHNLSHSNRHSFFNSIDCIPGYYKRYPVVG